MLVVIGKLPHLEDWDKEKIAEEIESERKAFEEEFERKMEENR